MSVSMISRSASILLATRALSRSLSPKAVPISAVEMLSFSLRIGTTPRPQQGLDGVAEVQIGLAVAQDLGGQQDLGDLDAARAERPCGTPASAAAGRWRRRPAASSSRSACRRGCSCPAPMPMAPEVTITTCRPLSSEGLDLGGHPAEVRGVDPAVFGQGVRADLDDHSFCLAEITHNGTCRHYTSRCRPFKAQQQSVETEQPKKGRR